jgi:predicted TIM-barrel fold metal-dependent hydrolase
MTALDRALHIDRVVLTALYGYGTDNSCLLDALKKLGPTGRGAAIIDAKTTDNEMTTLDRARCVGIRFNLGEGVGGARKPLQWAARRLKHHNRYVGAGGILSRLYAIQDDNAVSSVPVVFEHLSGPRPSSISISRASRRR